MRAIRSHSCIESAQRALAENNIEGEIIVADNGSTDGSREIAAQLGARVVEIKAKGYGNALMGGINAARGKYVLMADSDGSYDFGEIPSFVAKLREGYDIVQGCRLPSGGGRVMPGAMPFLHRWVGNPFFSFLTRAWFKAPIHDTNCGQRAFTKEFYDLLDQRCTGMEFANEMIIKSSMYGARMAEVPVTLRPDGRKAHGPHLRTFRDGWRTLRFLMMYSPRWLFLVPGSLLILAGTRGLRRGYARIDNPGSEVRRSHADLCDAGDSARLSIDYLRGLHKDVCDKRAIDAGRQPDDAVLEIRKPRKRVDSRGCRTGRGLVAAFGSDQPVGRRSLSGFGLQPHDAMGDTGRSADGAGVSNHSFKLLYKHTQNAPPVKCASTDVLQA